MDKNQSILMLQGQKDEIGGKGDVGEKTATTWDGYKRNAVPGCRYQLDQVDKGGFQRKR